MRQVIPILAKPCEPNEMPPTWDVLHRYDATGDYQVALAGLLQAIGLSDVRAQPVVGLVLCVKCGKLFDHAKIEQCSFHPSEPVPTGRDGGARADYRDVYTFPCCGKSELSRVGSDGFDYPPYRWPGCKMMGKHISDGTR